MSGAKTQMRLSITYHPSAECEECDWTVPPDRNAQRLARQHVSETGHQVAVIRERRSIWSPS